MDEIVTFTVAEAKIVNHVNYYASKEWGYCAKPYTTISRELGYSKKTVYLAVRKAKKLNLMQIEFKGQKGAHKKTPLFTEESEKVYAKVYANRPYSIYKYTNLATERGVDNLQSNERKITIQSQLKSLGLNRGDMFKAATVIDKHDVNVDDVKAAVEGVKAYDGKNVIRSKVALLIIKLKDRATKNKEEDEMSRITPEVQCMIDKHFPEHEKSMAESVLRRFKAPPAAKVLSVETFATKRNWMRNNGKKIRNVEALLMHTCIDIRDNYYNKHNTKPVDTPKKDYFGVSVEDIQKHARAGETYEQAAIRLKGGDVAEALVCGIPKTEIFKRAKPGETEFACAQRLWAEKKGETRQSTGMSRWAGMEIAEEKLPLEPSSAELEARAAIAEFRKNNASQPSKGSKLG
jgi:hypothetical protein